jgi:YD repeat-containing protein
MFAKLLAWQANRLQAPRQHRHRFDRDESSRLIEFTQS